MKIHIIDDEHISSLEPLTCRRKAGQIQVGGKTLGELLRERIEQVFGSLCPGWVFSAVVTFWPSIDFLYSLVRDHAAAMVIMSPEERCLAWISADGQPPGEAAERIVIPPDSRQLCYPWDLLAVNEEIVGALPGKEVKGKVEAGVTISGKVIIGERSVLLPGVFIEGNVIIGKNCKIGPNCYLRGNTYIADNCHVGQSNEIKNSILMNDVSAGHLNYIGDSIICSYANLGGGTITANFRHDGKNHRSMIDGKLIDTGRRKLGSIIGDNVHTGIHTAIYPGRKIWPDMSTLPGAVVRKDITP